MTALQQNVLGLDVAMYDAERMRRAECVGDLARNVHRHFNRELPLAVQSCSKRLTGDVRHYIVQSSVGFTGIEERQDVRMLELCSHLDFGKETLCTKRSAQVGVQHLDRDVAPVLQVVRQVDSRHPAGAKLALDAIAVAEGLLELSRKIVAQVSVG